MEMQSPQAMLNDIAAKLSGIETKVKLNEQNFFNLNERMQLLSQNFLDIKKELLGKMDNLTEETHEIEKAFQELNEKMAKMDSRVMRVPKAEDVEQIKKFHQSINVFKPEMSREEADKILDDVLKKLEV